MISGLVASIIPQNELVLNSDRHNPQRLEFLAKMLNIARIMKYLGIDPKGL